MHIFEKKLHVFGRKLHVFGRKMHIFWRKCMDFRKSGRFCTGKCVKFSYIYIKNAIEFIESSGKPSRYFILVSYFRWVVELSLFILPILKLFLPSLSAKKFPNFLITTSLSCKTLHWFYMYSYCM